MSIVVTDIGYASTGGNFVTSLTITTTADCPAGSKIVVAAAWPLAGDTGSIADSGGNTWSSAGPTQSGSSETLYLFWATAKADLPVGSTITVTIASTDYYWSIAGAVATGVGAVDLIGPGATGSSATPSISTGVLGSASEVVFAGFRPNGTPAFTQAPGFTSDSPNVGNQTQLAHQIVSSTASVTYAPTLGTSAAWVVNFVTFKAATTPNPFRRDLTFLTI